VVRISKIKRQEKRKKVVLKLIRRKIQRYKTEKIVIYYNIISKVKRFIEVLDYNIYYYNTVGKDSMLKEFIKEDKQVIIVINLLNISINILDIRCIIYIN
ncbi:hypothetical protein K469DRAFT_613299, partial [Zopfia rhizophila CBS 207.26]